jgi:hypothetical protein
MTVSLRPPLSNRHSKRCSHDHRAPLSLLPCHVIPSSGSSWLRMRWRPYRRWERAGGGLGGGRPLRGRWRLLGGWGGALLRGWRLIAPVGATEVFDAGPAAAGCETNKPGGEMRQGQMHAGPPQGSMLSSCLHHTQLCTCSLAVSATVSSALTPAWRMQRLQHAEAAACRGCSMQRLQHAEAAACRGCSSC